MVLPDKEEGVAEAYHRKGRKNIGVMHRIYFHYTTLDNVFKGNFELNGAEKKKRKLRKITSYEAPPRVLSSPWFYRQLSSRPAPARQPLLCRDQHGE